MKTTKKTTKERAYNQGYLFYDYYVNDMYAEYKYYMKNIYTSKIHGFNTLDEIIDFLDEEIVNDTLKMFFYSIN